ncbi:YceI family protein [Pseudohalioglobus sediminis]|uniref:YceI family protein n=1 Tax=Pseudohalioglobus sediminis TaxID=2606449 RepID=A0A5B0WVW6_9GAMM|nr:YceI family protein [Pseudohalioglobus sediminis]
MGGAGRARSSRRRGGRNVAITGRILGIILGSALIAAQANAQWELNDSNSVINFVSVKNASIAETHSFPVLMGYISEQGAVRVSIDLNSVETLIPIRNERMRKMLFNTAKFPAAKVSAEVDTEVLAEASRGGTVTTELPVNVSLHGVEQSVSVPVVVFSDSGHLRVMSSRPVLLRAEDFGLAAGVDALREVAGLSSISTAIPVTLNLQFRQAE